MKALACEDGGGTQPPPFAPPEPEAFTMRYFQPPASTRFYAGVLLHARSLFLAGPGRRSPPDCWVWLVFGLWGQESPPPPIASRVAEAVPSPPLP